MAKVFPQQFGPYTLHQLVGRGGMAEIYRATMPGIGTFEKVLAIKKVLPHLVENEEYITMLTDEARLVVGLNHANIAQVYDLGRIDDSYYIAMEYVHGVDIAIIIKDAQKKGRPIPYEHVAYMMSGLCMGLHVAHHATDKDGRALNIIHRDISPHNVLISFAGDVKVIDFGVAKASSKEGQTQVGVIKGKLLYMAPEQAKAADIDGRADLFAAGLVMYKMLTWELPFQGENEFQIYNNILTKEIVPPKTLNASIPDELNRICMKLLQRDVEARYQDGYAAKRDLERALHRIAPGYVQDRLSRFIEDSFFEQVKARLQKQNEPAKVKEPVMTPQAAQSARPQPAQPVRPQPAQPSYPVQPATPAPQMNFGATPQGTQPARTASNDYNTPPPGPAPQSPAFPNSKPLTPYINEPEQAAPAHLADGMPPIKQKKKGIPAILIAVVVLGVLFLGMGIYVAMKAGEESDPVKPDEPSQMVTKKEDFAVAVPLKEPAIKDDVPDPPTALTYTISSTPEGATCFLNGMRQGTTPLNLEISEYPASLRLEMEGYVSELVSIKRDDDTQKLTIPMTEEPVAEPDDSPKEDTSEPGATTPDDKPRDRGTKSSSSKKPKKPEPPKEEPPSQDSDLQRNPGRDAEDLFAPRTKKKPKKKKPSKKTDQDAQDNTSSQDKEKDKNLDDVLGGWQ